MDEFAFQCTVYQIAVSLMEWQLVHFQLSALIDVLFSWWQK